jgi:hypothetical protein
MRLAGPALFTALLLFLSGCVSPGLNERVRALEVEADRQAVTRLMSSYAHGIDSMDEAMLRRTFAVDAIAEYAGANFPMDERLEGIEAILDWLRENVGDRKDAVPWHYMSTALVEIDGDRGMLQTFQHNRTMSGVGLYTVHARRTPNGWRIARLHLDETILDESLLESLRADDPAEVSNAH